MEAALKVFSVIYLAITNMKSMEGNGILNAEYVTNARILPVLMYHHVSNKLGLVTLSPRTFRAQMKWLAESGWETR